jgi:hypothetical protein
MEIKLSSKLRKSVIERAKTYAKSHNVSLSGMIELYLDSLTLQTKKVSEITPLVESLSGEIHLKKDINLKMDNSDYLNEKFK